MNIFNETHKRFLIELITNDVDFIIVGGLSVIFHGYVRTTGDMDLWVRPSNDNKIKLLAVLDKLNISTESLQKVDSKDFSEAIAFHLNQPPFKIECFTHISGLHYDEAAMRCEYLETENIKIPFLGFEDLIVNKLMTGRLKDQADVEELQKIHRKNQP